MSSPTDENVEVVVEEVEWIDPTPKRRRRRPPAPPEPHPSLKDLFENAIDEGKRYVDLQIELFKLKIQRAMGQAAGAIVMAVMALLFGLLFLFWIFHTIEVALILVVAPWAASLIVLGILLLLILIFAGVAYVLVLGAKRDMPDPKEAIQKDVETLKADLQAAKGGQDSE